MPIPNPHAGEPTVEVNSDLWEQWLNAQHNAKGWQVEADKLKAAIQAQLGDAYAVTVNGEKVATYRPSVSYAQARIMADYPDLVQHFMRPKTSEVFDMEAFAIRHPDIAAQYQVRQFKVVGGDK